MEDQRNWTDASFKTYSTPLALGFPHRARAGQEIRQRIRLTFEGAQGLEPVDDDTPIRIELGAPAGGLPAIGLGVASHGEPLSEREAELLRLLRLDHLRANGDEIARTREEARAIGAELEVALVDGIDALKDGGAARYVLFDERLIAPARERLGEEAEIAAGTDGWFVEVNRDRPDLSGADAVAYSTTATVHADDDTSVAETPAAQGDTVRSAATLWPGLRVVVGPVTLRPRLWPFGSFGSGELPYQVDPRQCSLFGAAWTAASLKHLAEAGAAAVTYFETTGWRGVMETEAGSPRPDLFPSRPGQVFPLFHVLADAADWKDARLYEARSSAPLAVEALALRDGGLHMLVANLTPETQRCTVAPLPDRVSIRVLDDTTAVAAGERPEEFRSRTEQVAARDGAVELELRPYAVVRLDA
jgi:D-apionolactonase